MMKPSIIAAIFVAVGIPTAIAQPADPYGSDLAVRVVDVYAGDLDLADPGDRDEATWRVQRAADLACQPDPDLRAFDERSDYLGCRAEAFDEGISELEGRSARTHRRGRVYTREHLPGQ